MLRKQLAAVFNERASWRVGIKKAWQSLSLKQITS
jgi:hypothetical protein